MRIQPLLSPTRPVVVQTPTRTTAKPELRVGSGPRPSHGLTVGRRVLRAAVLGAFFGMTSLTAVQGATAGTRLPSAAGANLSVTESTKQKAEAAAWAERWDQLNTAHDEHEAWSRRWRNSGSGFDHSESQRKERTKLRAELRALRPGVLQKVEQFNAVAEQQAFDWDMSAEAQLFLRNMAKHPGYSAALIAAVSAWKEATALDVRDLTPKDLRTLADVAYYPASPDRLRAILQNNPSDLLETPDDLVQLASSEMGQDEATMQRIEVLRSVGVDPIAADLALVATLDDAQFKGLESFLGQVRDIAPLSFRDVARPYQDLARWLWLSDRRPEGFEDRLRALVKNSDVQNIHYDHASLVLAMMKTDRPGLVMLLRHTSLEGHATPRSVFNEAKHLPKELAPVDAELQKLTNQLGRKLSFPELSLALRGIRLDAPLSASLTELRLSEGVQLKDIYAAQHMDPLIGEMSREDLLSSLSGLKQGSVRADREAQYTSSPQRNLHKLSTPELRKVKLVSHSLEQPRILNQVAAMLAADLKDGEPERGGLLKIEDGQLQFKEVPNRFAGTQWAVYSAPKSTNQGEAVAEFHLHAIEESGNAWAAGPSGMGKGGDLSAAAASGQDGLVITYLGDDGDGAAINVDFYTPSGVVVDLGDHRLTSN